jgi:hypothetical protein
MKTYWEWRCSSTILDRDTTRRLSASGLCRFSLGERAPGSHWIEGWVGLRAGLDIVELRKVSYPAWNRTSAVRPVARRNTD